MSDEVSPITRAGQALVRRRRVPGDLTVDVKLTPIQDAVADLMRELLSLIHDHAGHRAVVVFAGGTCAQELARSYARRYAELGRIRPSEALNLETSMFLARISPLPGYSLTSFVIDDSLGSFDAVAMCSRMVDAGRSDVAINYGLRRDEDGGFIEVAATLIVASSS